MNSFLPAPFEPCEKKKYSNMDFNFPYFASFNFPHFKIEESFGLIWVKL